jgi:outer membrane receptor protein involved in Fe transport
MLVPAFVLTSIPVLAQTASIVGTVRDETGGVLPGVSVELRDGRLEPAITDENGVYRFDGVSAGHVELSFALVNFGAARRTVVVPSGGGITVDQVLHFSLSAAVTITAGRTFSHLADAEDPAQSLIGVAQSATQGAVVARQLETRPVMRAGEVLETVPGLVISQHSGEGKANQYYLRGFNLDHGTDFATTMAGMPVNMPTHGHGHGYSDTNFLIPELVSRVQFAKGPYFAANGDFATAGAANISYVNLLASPMVRVEGGGDAFVRALVAASRRTGAGHVLAAFEVNHNDGPWVNPDNFRRFNGVARYSRGNSVNGFSVTGMGYRAAWDSTDQIPLRAVEQGSLDRFDAVDTSDGGDTYRYSASLEWQRTRSSAATRVSAYGVRYDLNLFSNFTYFLNDPTRGDQFRQADRRSVLGGTMTHARLLRWGGRLAQQTFGIEIRHDDISGLSLEHSHRRVILHVLRADAVAQTSGALLAQNEIEWYPRLRTIAGLRADGYRFDVRAHDPVNSGVARAGIISPKGSVIIGPFHGTELYVNAGYGFHSNDARGATISRDPVTQEPAERVTPLARARGMEFGLRSVAIQRLQTTVAVWRLGLASELLFIGDAGTTEASRPSLRSGVEVANYYRPLPWLTFDADLAWSRARFTDGDPEGDQIPGSVRTVVSTGVAVDDLGRAFGSVRLRYFGPRPLVEDGSVESAATSLVNLQAGYKLSNELRLSVNVFNLFDAADSDVDYYYRSRLPGEPVGGMEDVHFHPTLPRTVRVTLGVSF